MNNSADSRPSLIRRFAAIAYDAVLLAAVLLIGAAPLPLLAEQFLRSEAGHWLVRAYILSVSFVFFAWFWVHGGQTLGMRAWRLRLVSATNGPVSWPMAGKRFFAAILSWLPAGAGFVWSLFDQGGLTWHDRLSQSRLRLEPKSSHSSQQNKTRQHED